MLSIKSLLNIAKNHTNFWRDKNSCYKRTVIGYLPDGRKLLYHEDQDGRLIGYPSYTQNKEYALDWLNLTMEE